MPAETKLLVANFINDTNKILPPLGFGCLLLIARNVDFFMRPGNVDINLLENAKSMDEFVGVKLILFLWCFQVSDQRW